MRKEDTRGIKMNDKIGYTKGIDKILVVLGYCIIGIGITLALVLAGDVYMSSFNWSVFMVSLLSVCFSGGILIGLGEIISRLDTISKATQEAQEINTKMGDILQYQQGILDAILEEQNNHKKQ